MQRGQRCEEKSGESEMDGFHSPCFECLWGFVFQPGGGDGLFHDARAFDVDGAIDHEILSGRRDDTARKLLFTVGAHEGLKTVRRAGEKKVDAGDQFWICFRVRRTGNG